eukprot:TRINITY_DN1349_c0_g2_i5.p1 TRINITY_DN1349_c0_g2~~TRINITY_DN1349_c0_g2_i5.p1  ORF type:complete len:742 (-),score=225.88 TRINITY_DN1349_c0_g2_i5:60-2285(-)
MRLSHHGILRILHDLRTTFHQNQLWAETTMTKQMQPNDIVLQTQPEYLHYLLEQRLKEEDYRGNERIENSPDDIQTVRTQPFSSKKAFVFPIYSQPLFPNVIARTTPLRASTANINEVINLIFNQTKWKEVPDVKTNPSEKEEERHVCSITIVMNGNYVHQFRRLKEQGETHIVLSLSRSKQRAMDLEDLFSIGVLAEVGKIYTHSGKEVCVELIITHRVAIGKQLKKFAINDTSYFKANITLVQDRPMEGAPGDLTDLSEQLEFLWGTSPLYMKQKALFQYRIEKRHFSELADISVQLSLATPAHLKQRVLEEADVSARLKTAIEILKEETQFWKLRGKIGRQPKRPQAADKGKKVEDIAERIKNIKLPEHAMKVVNEEMNKLQNLDPTVNASEYYVCKNYLEWIVSLPWGIESKDELHVGHTEDVLNEDHFGLEDVKLRIAEFIAVASLKGTLNGKILCLVGPPGVGKTSIGKSIAHATKRQFYRFSVGGLSDVAEIKGHRRTYVGALPGRFIQCLKTVGTSNPIILLDEIDKLSKAYDGDPASALLEALDPEQNSAFLDHYLDLPFDLSKVLFVCTANSLDTIPKPLLDRMEVIRLHGYFLEEKLEIAKRHLIPGLLKENGLSPAQVEVTDEILRKLIGNYSREAGVRSLKRNLDKVFRKVAYKVAKGEKELILVDENSLENFIGKPKFHSDRLYDETPPGVVTGLAWNSVGGALIWIETVTLSSNNKTSKLEITEAP